MPEIDAVGDMVRVRLPEPPSNGLGIFDAIRLRRSVRVFSKDGVGLEHLASLLWAGQGVTESVGGILRRTTPSAGATYPLFLYAVVGEGGVEGLASGVYRYVPEGHELVMVRGGDIRKDLYRAALRQGWVRDAPVSIIIAADFRRTTSVYGARGIRYVYMEAGHSSQNIYLAAESLGLGTVAVAAFYDDEVKRVLGIVHDPLYIMPVGWPRKRM